MAAVTGIFAVACASIVNPEMNLVEILGYLIFLFVASRTVLALLSTGSQRYAAIGSSVFAWGYLFVSRVCEIGGPYGLANQLKSLVHPNDLAGLSLHDELLWLGVLLSAILGGWYGKWMYRTLETNSDVVG